MNPDDLPDRLVALNEAIRMAEEKMRSTMEAFELPEPVKGQDGDDRPNILSRRSYLPMVARVDPYGYHSEHRFELYASKDVVRVDFAMNGARVGQDVNGDRTSFISLTAQGLDDLIVALTYIRDVLHAKTD